MPGRIAPFAKDLYHCADCSYCVDATWTGRGIAHVCPTIEHHRPVPSYSGRGYLAAARALAEGEALAPAVLAERVFSCTGCANCEQVCPIGLRPAQLAQALREELVEQGHAPPAIGQLRATMRACGNPYGKPPATRGEWARGLAFANGEATVLYAPGCAAACGDPAEPRAVVRLLALAGEKVGWRGDDDRCCGAPLRETGLAEDARYAEQRLASDVFAPRVVSSGLECLPAWGGVAGCHAQGFPEWFAAALDAGRLRVTPRDHRAVVAFDGCANRRPEAGDTRPDRLREVLARIGVAVVNDAHGAATALCCGAAGGMPAMAPESAARMATARLDGLPDTLPIVVADPRCLSHLAAAAGERRPRLLGLAAFVATHCEATGVGHD
jgi:Fe-S oxidoreductase